MDLEETREETMMMFAEFINKIGLDGEWYAGLKKTPLCWGTPNFGAAGEYMLPSNINIEKLLQINKLNEEMKKECKLNGLIVINHIFKNLKEPSRELYETLIHESIHASRTLLLFDVYRGAWGNDNVSAYSSNNDRLEQNSGEFSNQYVDASQQILKGNIDTSNATIHSYDLKSSDEIEDATASDIKIQRQMNRQHIVDEALVELMAQLSYKIYSSKKQGKEIDVFEALNQIRNDTDETYLMCEASKKDTLKRSARIMCDIILRHHDLELFYWMLDPITYSNGDMHYDFFSEYTKNDEDILLPLFEEGSVGKNLLSRFVHYCAEKANMTISAIRDTYRNFVTKLKNGRNKGKENQQLLDIPKTRYQELVESIDDLELSKMFIDGITPEIAELDRQRGDEAPEFPLQTKISKKHTIEISKKFFESLDEKLSKKVNEIIDGNNPNIILEMKENDDSGASVSKPGNIPIKVNVPISGNLMQLYEFIHEMTHTLDMDNGDTETRRVLGEVAPQCVERMLDDYLLEMSDEEMQTYGFERSMIGKDIKDRRLMTFLTRYHNAVTLNKGKGNRELNSRYLLAQVYSSHFNRFDKDKKRDKILSFIECVGNDDFEKANDVFEMKLDRKNTLLRSSYISDTIIEVGRLLKPRKVNRVSKEENNRGLASDPDIEEI